jgi:ABC-type proline/glycine betaine transport system permease subunit
MLLLGSMGLEAIGFFPAIIALIIYEQLPILRNTYTAIAAMIGTRIFFTSGAESCIITRELKIK